MPRRAPLTPDPRALFFSVAAHIAGGHGRRWQHGTVPVCRAAGQVRFLSSHTAISVVHDTSMAVCGLLSARPSGTGEPLNEGLTTSRKTGSATALNRTLVLLSSFSKTSPVEKTPQVAQVNRSLTASPPVQRRAHRSNGLPQHKRVKRK